jgi:UDP-GlcNAc:undecaprenyl-phosphate GlcNAc-1-phosphate transferase
VTGVQWWEYLALFLGAGVLALALTPVAKAVAVRRQIMDRPVGYKQQTAPIPYLGGAAIVAAFVIAVMLAAWIRPLTSGLGGLGVLLGLGLGLSLVGLLDDIRGLGPLTRLIVQTMAAVAVVGAGVQVHIFGSNLLNMLVTVVWIVGVTNAFNLLDNMDGLSAGVTAIAAGSFFLIAVLNGQFLVASLSVALAGCALGFLWHNFHPATIYMGDAGSLFFGFMLAVLGIKLRFEGPIEVTFFVPILVLGVALLDTTLVTVTRLLNKRNPLSGGNDHISHRLAHLGLSVPVAVGIIFAGSISLGWMGLVVSRLDRTNGTLLMAGLVTVGLFLGVMLALVPVYESADGALEDGIGHDEQIVAELTAHQAEDAR